MAGFAINLADLKLFRLPDREVQYVPKRRGPGLLLEINIEVLEHHGLKFREVDVAVAEPRTLPPPSLWQ